MPFKEQPLGNSGSRLPWTIECTGHHIVLHLVFLVAIDPIVVKFARMHPAFLVDTEVTVQVLSRTGVFTAWDSWRLAPHLIYRHLSVEGERPFTLISGQTGIGRSGYLYATRKTASPMQTHSLPALPTDAAH